MNLPTDEADPPLKMTEF